MRVEPHREGVCKLAIRFIRPAFADIVILDLCYHEKQIPVVHKSPSSPLFYLDSLNGLKTNEAGNRGFPWVAGQGN